jgi:probable F420-dependent oxidoreductase
MRFTFVESMIDPSFYVPLARCCEEAGFASFAVPDSVMYPEHSDTRYPYTPDGNREFLENKAIIDPFVLMATMAAVTHTLRFYPFVYKLPIRQPVLVAKQATSLATICNNRFSLGVGLSPWPEDYIACGEPWEKRGKRMDEMLEIIRGLCRGNFYHFEGEFYQIPSMKLCPIPSRPVPILIGGHADAALKRAAQYGDGWLHAGGSMEELEALIKKLKGYLKQFDRDDNIFQIHAISMDAFSVDGIKRMRDMGITDAVVGFHNTYALEQSVEPLEKKLSAIRNYANAIIAKVNS